MLTKVTACSAVLGEENHSTLKPTMWSVISTLLMTPFGSSSSRQMIAMITAVKSHGRMKSTRRMLRSTGLIRAEFRSSAKARPISRWKITLITVK